MHRWRQSLLLQISKPKNTLMQGLSISLSKRDCREPRTQSINISAVPPPECEHVIAFAKSLRESLTEELLACAGYDPDNAEEHISKCITSDRDLWLLKTCVHVQAIYRRKLMQSNYGYLPDTYRPIACDQTKDLLAKADSVRGALRGRSSRRTKTGEITQGRRGE